MLCTFERKKIDPDCLYGVVVAESDSRILVQEVYDFEFDGYVVVRRRDVTRSCSSDSNAYCEKLMRKDGLWRSPTKFARSLPLADWRTLLKKLMNRAASIENERQGTFYIGSIIKCDIRGVSIYHFDACGKWQNIERMPYRLITMVQFGNRYIDVHSRHLSPRPNKAVYASD
jgi:hypothetical protein